MKKIQRLMLMLLVAVVGLTMQSCGKDDNKTVSTLYTMSATVDVKNQGSLSDANVNYLKNSFSKSETGYYTSDAEAKTAADQAIQKYKSQIEAVFSDVNWDGEEANIVITINTTNNSTKAIVSQWTVTIYKGVKITQVK